MDASTLVWSPEHRAHWQRVAAHPFDNDGIVLDFTRRLARALGWPLDDTRGFRLVDRHRGRISSWLRRSLRLAGIGAGLSLATTPARAAWALPKFDWSIIDPFDLDGPSFLTLYAGLLVLVAMLTWLLRDMARTTDRRPDLRDLGEVELAYCVGGDARAADTLYVALASRGAARLDRNGIVVEGAMPGLPPQLEAFRQALAGSRSRKRFLSDFIDSSAYADALDRLLTRKILLGHRRRSRLDAANWLPVALLLSFGLATLCVGVAQGRAVGFVLFSLIATLFAFAAVLGRERYLTREASASLDALRASRSRALRAPLPEELAFAFAMLGTVALNGTAHAGYAKLVKPPSGGAASGCGTSSGGRDPGCGGCSG